jgi:hypothetical protein
MRPLSAKMRCFTLHVWKTLLPLGRPTLYSTGGIIERSRALSVSRRSTSCPTSIISESRLISACGCSTNDPTRSVVEGLLLSHCCSRDQKYGGHNESLRHFSNSQLASTISRSIGIRANEVPFRIQCLPECPGCPAGQERGGQDGGEHVEFGPVAHA